MNGRYALSLMIARPRKIFLFALPRSGSTLLCDLLTLPGKSFVMHEPMMLRNFGDGRGARITQTLAKFGIEVEPPPGGFRRGTPARDWFDSAVIPKLEELDFWGLKEVYLSDAQHLVQAYSPDALLLLWRDPRDVAVSMLELMNRSLMSFPDKRTLKDEAWALECLRESAQVLTRLASSYSHHRIRYEDWVSASGTAAEELRRYVGIDEFGQGRFALSDDHRGVRDPELSRHDRPISMKSVERWRQEPAGWRRTFAKVCHAALNRDAVEAGYAPAELREQDVCAASAATMATRIRDPHHFPERAFDFAYARRRARQTVATMIPDGTNVLDVGASTAALAFMNDRIHVTVVDDGAPGKRLLSRRWREGVFPALDPYQMITFLFSLEYVGDPRLMLNQLLIRGKNVILTYHCTDDFAQDRRDLLEFRSHLSRADWLAFASQMEAQIDVQWAIDGYQSLIRLTR